MFIFDVIESIVGEEIRRNVCFPKNIENYVKL